MSDKSLVVITGATSAIGGSIAARLATDGWPLLLVGRSPSKLKALREALVAPARHQECIVDLSDPGQFGAVAATARQLGTAVGGLVHIAGVWHNEGKLLYGTKLGDIPSSEFDRVLNVTYLSALKITHSIIPLFTQDGSARIIYLSGTFSAGAKNWVHYYVAKQNLEVLSRAVSDEYGAVVPTNCISPADVNTPPLRQHFPEDAAGGLDPKDVAELASYLMGPGGRYISGQTIVLRRRSN